MRRGFRIDRRENQMARRAIDDRLPEAIRRYPLDPEALDRLLRDEQVRIVAWQSRNYSRWIAVVTEMPLATRVEYADRLEKALRCEPKGPAPKR